MQRSTPPSVRTFWTPINPVQAASAHAEVPADGRFHRVVFELGSNEHWSGCLTSLRFDPTGSAGVAIEIRALRLEQGPRSRTTIRSGSSTEA